MDSYLIKINSTDFTPYLAAPGGYEVSQEKLFKDANRTLNGKLRTTFIGIFPKINLTLRNGLTDSDMATIVSILNDPTLTVEWYDVSSGSYETETFYPGSFPYSMHRKKISNIYDGFKVSLIAYNPKS